MVGVCVPVFNEVAAITVTVRSIFAADYPRDRLRVVVAVDGGDAGAAEAARAAGATVVEVIPNQGSYAARNAALDALGDDVTAVLFTDADCEVDRGWIRAHVSALEHAALSGGAVDFSFAGATPSPIEWVDSIRHLQQHKYVEHDGFAATCNLAVRRAVFADVRFDPTLRTGGDADFCLRATAVGHTLTYTPQARVSHPARASRRALLTKVRRIASGAATVPRAATKLPPTPRAPDARAVPQGAGCGPPRRAAVGSARLAPGLPGAAHRRARLRLARRRPRLRFRGGRAAASRFRFRGAPRAASGRG